MPSLEYAVQKQRTGMLSALEHGKYSIYMHVIENKKWGAVSSGDGSDTEMFFIVINGVDVWVDRSFYNSVAVGEQIWAVILKADDKKYLMLVPYKINI